MIAGKTFAGFVGIAALAALTGCGGDPDPTDPKTDDTDTTDATGTDTGTPPDTDTDTDPPDTSTSDTATPTVPACPPGPEPRISSTTGCILGTLTESGREQFLGVPFAEPPVGALRLAPTVPIAPWTEPRVADTLGPPCVRFGDSTFDPGLEPGVEDCLNLNVFRPAGAADLPLMVFIHGGGHTTGSGSAPYLVDDPALAEAAVVVTMNYRLGPLGYLAHPALSAEDPDGVSGNFGLQDVITAIRWAHDNAAALGGDPDRLVVFGESAGGLETCAVLGSPRAAGLADAAIIQSAPCGVLNKPLRGGGLLDVFGEAQGVSFAEAVGCPETDPDPAACLRAVPVETWVEVGFDPVGPLSGAEWHWEPWVDDVWMLDLPAAFAAGTWNQVPVTATVNGDEGTLFTAGLAPTPEVYDDWLTTLAFAYGVDREALAAQYDPALFDGSTDQAFAALFGDASFVCPTVFQQELLATQVPARGAFFVQEGDLSGGLGAFHGAEMPYVFGTLSDLSPPDREALSERMRAAWRTAADPTPTWSDLGAWPTVDAGWVELDTAPGRLVARPRGDACTLFEGSRVDPF